MCTCGVYVVSLRIASRQTQLLLPQTRSFAGNLGVVGTACRMLLRETIRIDTIIMVRIGIGPLDSW